MNESTSLVIMTKKMPKKLVLLTALLTSACMVGPNYQRPAPTPHAEPAAYKELKGWKPVDEAVLPDNGDWWQVFNDPLLDRLESQVKLSNQTIAEDEANYRASQQLVAEAQAGELPTLSASFDASRSAAGSGSTGSDYSTSGTRNTFAPGLSASWTADIWGEIRREIAETQQNAEVSKTTLAYATLSEQATLATDYFELRYEDALRDLLQKTVTAYNKALQITQNQYNAGTTSSADVVTAEAQLDSAEAQLTGVASTRATYEHAIAVLIGQAPAELDVPAGKLAQEVPVVPAGVPSDVLERRPDVQAAEHAVHAENEAIGVAWGAMLPTITLSASGGFSGNTLGNLFSVANRVWSLGADANMNLFEGGEQIAAVRYAHAEYDSAVAAYRLAVLTAMQGVEDQLATLHTLQMEETQNQATDVAAQHAVDVMLNEYQAGTVAYTSVVTEQTALLSDQQTLLSTQANRLVAAVTLIEDIGGGWKK